MLIPPSDPPNPPPTPIVSALGFFFIYIFLLLQLLYFFGCQVRCETDFVSFWLKCFDVLLSSTDNRSFKQTNFHFYFVSSCPSYLKSSYYEINICGPGPGPDLSQQPPGQQGGQQGGQGQEGAEGEEDGRDVLL